MSERTSLFPLVRQALENANKYRSDGNDRQYQEDLGALDNIEIAHEALRVQRDHYRQKLERWMAVKG